MEARLGQMLIMNIVLSEVLQWQTAELYKCFWSLEWRFFPPLSPALCSQTVTATEFLKVLQ